MVAGMAGGKTRSTPPDEEPEMPDPHLLAADVDRSAVVTRLDASLTDGRLTLAEYEDRSARAHAARTYGELTELTADLPSAARPAAPEPRRSAVTRAVPAGAPPLRPAPPPPRRPAERGAAGRPGAAVLRRHPGRPRGRLARRVGPRPAHRLDRVGHHRGDRHRHLAALDARHRGPRVPLAGVGRRPVGRRARRPHPRRAAAGAPAAGHLTSGAGGSADPAGCGPRPVGPRARPPPPRRAAAGAPAAGHLTSGAGASATPGVGPAGPAV